MSDYSLDGQWNVIFSDKATGEDIAELSIYEDDLRIIYSLPKKGE